MSAIGSYAVLERRAGEYGEQDADGMVEAIAAAHAFYARGMGEITAEHLVVFLIQ